MDEQRKQDAAHQVRDLEPRTEEVEETGADANVKGGLLSSALGSAPALKQSAQLNTSVDPGKVQGFQCDGRL